MRYAFLSFILLVLASAASAGPSLKGSPASQMRQNSIADKARLTRIQDRDQLKAFIKAGLLVEVVPTASFFFAKEIGEADPSHGDLYRHARPWVKKFLEDVSAECYAVTGERLEVTSLVRTAAYQRSLVRGGNRAAIRGHAWWQRSSHLTGSTVDISYLGLQPATVRWLEKKLRALEKAGLVEATEEYGNNCFHVMVFPKYGEPAQAPKPRKTRKSKRPAR